MTTIGNKLINVKIKSVKLEASNLSICVHNVDDSNVKLLESLLENAFDEECRYTDEEEVPVMGGLYVAQLKEGVHERCRVALCDKIGCTAKIRCIDSKIDRRLGFDQLRPIKSSSQLLKLPAQCREYVISGIHLLENADFRHNLLIIHQALHTAESLKLEIVQEHATGCYVNLYLCDRDLVTNVLPNLNISEKSIKYLPLADQMSQMSEYMAKQQMRPITRNLKAPPPPKFYANDPEPILNAVFKTNVLPHDSLKKGRISHYENGPQLFYVQLESMDSDFQRFVSHLQRAPLHNIKTRPASVGIACLAQYHRKIYRVAIAKLPHDNHQDYIVNFVDYGFNASVRHDQLFHIPNEFLQQLTFAMPFRLANIKKADIKMNDKEMNFYFRLVTENRLVSLKCTSADEPPICQNCILTVDDGKTVLSLLEAYDPYALKYPSPGRLENKTYEVKVVYIDSAQDFYVHLQDATSALHYDMYYDQLQKIMAKSLTVRKPSVGLVCAVQINGEYFRATIIMVGGNVCKVRIIDFGAVEEVPISSIRLMTPKFVERPSFAFRAGLKGFENEKISENINTQFDIFCGDGRDGRKVFKMTVLDVLKDSVLCELDDNSINPPVNVNRLLLKNSRPLSETIQLENAKKRQREAKKDSPKAADDQDMQNRTPQLMNNNNRYDRSSAQRGRGNQVNKGDRAGSHASSVESDWNSRQQSPKTHFGKQTNERREASPERNGKQRKPEWEESPKKNDKNEAIKAKSPKRIINQQLEKSPQPTIEKKKSTSDIKVQGGVQKKQQRTGWVSTLLSVNKGFVHFEEQVDELEKMLDNMFSFYEEKSRPLLKDLKINGMCAAKSVEDSNWYRSRIEAIDGNNVKVFYLEYGNSEVVPKSMLRVLDEKFCKLNALAVKSFFAIKPAAEGGEKELHKEMLTRFGEGTIEFLIHEVQQLKDGCVVELIDQQSNKNVFDELVAKKKIVRVSIDELTKLLDEKPILATAAVAKSPPKPKKEQSPKKAAKADSPSEKNRNANKKIETEAPQKAVEVVAKEEEPPQKPPTNRINAKLVALTSPTDFYLNRSDLIANYNQLQTDIQILGQAMPPLTDFDEGTSCLAKSPYDNQWYRAKIIDSDCDTQSSVMITVRSLDDGKTFSIDNELELRTMPEELLRQKFFGIPCSLIVKIERRFEEEATTLMKEMMEKQVEFAAINKQSDDSMTCYVDLFVNDESITDKLVALKYAHRLPVVPSGNGYTSHINSLHDFYLQFESDQLKLDIISRFFEKEHKADDTIAATPGKIVTALFPDDGCWYRAKIESVEGSDYEVSFIDYGNTCTVKQIGAIEEETIAAIPALSTRCCLKKPKGVRKFGDAAKKKFVEICANGATILSVNLAKPGDPVEVELHCDGKNIADELIPLCELTKAEALLDSTNESIET